MMDLSPLVDATLVLLGVVSVLILGVGTLQSTTEADTSAGLTHSAETQNRPPYHRAA